MIGIQPSPHTGLRVVSAPVTWPGGFPLARPGLITASVLGFAHTVGEFGVVLMIGGNIPGETRVMSVAIYDHVEAAEFADAHRLSAVLVGFALVVLVTLYAVNRPARPTLADRR